MSYVKNQIEQSDPRFQPSRNTPVNRGADAEWIRTYNLVRDEYDRILKEEGSWHVGGAYFANSDDADRQRMWLASKRVRESLRAGS